MKNQRYLLISKKDYHMYYFYFKNDLKREKIGKTSEFSTRLDAAKYFATIKKMKLKDFLSVFAVSK